MQLPPTTNVVFEAEDVTVDTMEDTMAEAEAIVVAGAEGHGILHRILRNVLRLENHDGSGWESHLIGHAWLPCCSASWS